MLGPISVLIIDPWANNERTVSISVYVLRSHCRHNGLIDVLNLVSICEARARRAFRSIADGTIRRLAITGDVGSISACSR
jgi:hypothetical protein